MTTKITQPTDAHAFEIPVQYVGKHGWVFLNGHSTSSSKPACADSSMAMLVTVRAIGPEVPSWQVKKSAADALGARLMEGRKPKTLLNVDPRIEAINVLEVALHHLPARPLLGLNPLREFDSVGLNNLRNTQHRWFSHLIFCTLCTFVPDRKARHLLRPAGSTLSTVNRIGEAPTHTSTLILHIELASRICVAIIASGSIGCYIYLTSYAAQNQPNPASRKVNP